VPITNAIDPAVALAALAAMNDKVDAITEKLATTPADELTVRTIPAGVRDRTPSAPTAALPAGADAEPAAAAAPTEGVGPPPPDVKFPSVRDNERTDSEVFARIRAFLDPTQMGPLFKSEPIRRRVYFAKYPSFAELLSPEKVIGPAPKSAKGEGNEDLAAMWEAAGELGVVVLGSLAEYDPGIEHILAHPAKPSEWPPLRRFTLANNRDPHLIPTVIALWKQYLRWKVDVTPTDAELEKYWAQTS
jgi:hypothetical protein